MVVQRTFTTSDIANALDVSEPTIRKFALDHNFCTINESRPGKAALWDFVFYKACKEYIELRKAKTNKSKKEIEKRKLALQAEKEKDLAEQKKLHPLVTDERCFNLNWWPNTVPNNLSDFIN